MKSKNIKLAVTVLAVSIAISFIIHYPTNVSAEKAPDFTLTDIEGSTFNLSDFKGKVVILDFMATWCSGCKAMMDDLKEARSRYPDAVIISIDIDPTENNEELENLKNHYGADWIFSIDTDGVGLKYGVAAIPKTVILNPSGEISFSHTGEVSASRLSSEIEKAEAGGKAGGIFFGLGLPVLAFVAGILSFFSPCAFPLLPGYMVYYIGKGGNKTDNPLRKSFRKGLQPAAGLLIFDAALGTAAILAGGIIKPFIPYFGPMVGILLLIFGMLMLANIPFFTTLTSKFLNRTSGLAGKDSGLGLFFYGVVYAGAAAGCTAPVFIGIVLLALSGGGLLWGIFIFLIYAMAMAVVMVVVTILIAMSKDVVLKKLKISTRYMERVAGAILIIVGVYLIYYYLKVTG